jgi:glycine/D-amino acid oxidase-like deaminating enzyme
MFANPYGTQASAQLDAYLSARAAFSNPVFPAMGNHECTGATTSNCGKGNRDDITQNYASFMTKMLAPLGVENPWYTVEVASTTGAWTAKFVVVAANAWSASQGAWLDAELAKPTTYTFVVRHESVNAATAPGVAPSEAIMAKHRYTLAIVGHSHEYRYDRYAREIIVGNGGAPLTGASNHGYVIARQRADGAIVFTSYDFVANAVVETFALTADGKAAP